MGGNNTEEAAARGSGIKDLLATLLAVWVVGFAVLIAWLALAITDPTKVAYETTVVGTTNTTNSVLSIDGATKASVDMPVLTSAPRARRTEPSSPAASTPPGDAAPGSTPTTPADAPTTPASGGNAAKTPAAAKASVEDTTPTTPSASVISVDQESKNELIVTLLAAALLTGVALLFALLRVLPSPPQPEPEAPTTNVDDARTALAAAGRAEALASSIAANSADASEAASRRFQGFALEANEVRHAVSSIGERLDLTGREDDGKTLKAEADAIHRDVEALEHAVAEIAVVEGRMTTAQHEVDQAKQAVKDADAPGKKAAKSRLDSAEENLKQLGDAASAHNETVRSLAGAATGTVTAAAKTAVKLTLKAPPPAKTPDKPAEAAPAATPGAAADAAADAKKPKKETSS